VLIVGEERERRGPAVKLMLLAVKLRSKFVLFIPTRETLVEEGARVLRERGVENTWGVNEAGVVEKVGAAEYAPRGGNAAEGLGGMEEMVEIGAKTLFVDDRGGSDCVGTGSSSRRGARAVRFGASAGRAADGAGASSLIDASAERATSGAGAAAVTVCVMGARGIGWKGWLVGEMDNISIVFPTVLLTWSSKFSMYVNQVKK
jgi:hypothetical protein